MADRIVLLRDGKIEQQGAPLDLYERPATRYVAGFLGSPSMNFVDAEIASVGGRLTVRIGESAVLSLPASRFEKLSAHVGKPIVLGIRPEHISRAREGDAREGLARCAATIDLVQPTGARTYATFKLGGVESVAELQAHDVSQPGEPIDLAIDMNRAVIIEPSTEKVIQ